MLDTQLPQMEERKAEEMMFGEVLVEDKIQRMLINKGLILAHEHYNALYMFMPPTTTHFDENTETIEMEEFF